MKKRENKLTSRKFWYAVTTSVFIFMGACIAAAYPTFHVGYSEMIAGLLGTLTIYSGANVGVSALLKRKPEEPPVES